MSGKLMMTVLATLLACEVGLAQSLRDPTRPAGASAPSQISYAPGAPLRLEAILRSGEARRAIVNGQVVRLGGRIGDAVITEISADSIRYTRNGREHVAALPIRKVPVRKPSVLQAGEP